MSRDDDEPELKPRLGELHLRECADAPSFEAMRRLAPMAAGTQSYRSVPAPLLLWSASTAVVTAILLWLGGHVFAPAAAPTPPESTGQHVEQLLNSIEHQSELSTTISGVLDEKLQLLRAEIRERVKGGDPAPEIVAKVEQIERAARAGQVDEMRAQIDEMLRELHGDATRALESKEQSEDVEARGRR